MEKPDYVRRVIEGEEKKKVNDSLQFFIPPSTKSGSGTCMDTLVKKGGKLDETVTNTAQFFGAVPPGAEELIKIWNQRPQQQEPRRENERTEETRISFSINLVDINRYHTLQDIKHYTLPENTTVKQFIEKIKDDMNIQVMIRLTNDKSKLPLDLEKTLKDAGIKEGMTVYAFQDSRADTSVSQPMKSAS